MSKILKFYNKEKKETGSMRIKNQTEKSAELYLYGDIVNSVSEDYKEWYPDDKGPKDVREFLAEIGEVDNLDIHINSGGGSVFGGIAIANILKANKAYKTVYIDGIAASIASVIACVGDKVVMPNNATFMMHKPLLGYFFEMLNADDLRKDAETLDSCQKALMNTYMAKVKDGVSEETVEELVNKETWLVGDEVLDYFDFKIIEDVKAVACNSDYFDKYFNVPEELKSKPINAEPTEEIKAKELEKAKAELLEDLDYI